MQQTAWGCNNAFHCFDFIGMGRTSSDLAKLSGSLVYNQLERTKTKAAGEHTRILHKGVLGHRLHADATNSKHFRHVLAENDLVCVTSPELVLSVPETALTALKKYGPIMIGGQFYRVAQFYSDCKCWKLTQRDFKPILR